MSEFQTIELDNGIRVVHQWVDSPITHACIVIPAGSRHEQPGRYGLAHFIEHLLFKKTSRRNTSQIINWLESVGADLNAYTTKEYTCLHASFLNPYLGRTLDLFEDLLFHSEFPDEELRKEKGIIMDEIASYRDNPEEAIMDDFEDLVFAGHGLGHNILGLESDLMQLGKPDVLDFIAQQYHTTEMVIGISGRYASAEVRRKVSKYFGHIPRTSRTPAQDTPLPPCQSHGVESKMPINQVHYVLGAPAYSLHHAHRTGLSLLNNMLGGMGMGSRLNMLVREKYGIAYTIESNYHAFQDTGLFSVYFGTDEDKWLRARELVLREMKKLRDRQLGSMTIHGAKKKFKGQIALGEENRLSLIIGQAKSLLDHGEILTLETLFSRIDAVTGEQLLEIANEVFDPNHFYSMAFLPE